MDQFDFWSNAIPTSEKESPRDPAPVTANNCGTWTWEPHPWSTPKEVSRFLQSLGGGASNGRWRAMAQFAMKEGISGAMLLANSNNCTQVWELFRGLQPPIGDAIARTVVAAVKGIFSSGSQTEDSSVATNAKRQTQKKDDIAKSKGPSMKIDGLSGGHIIEALEAHINSFQSRNEELRQQNCELLKKLETGQSLARTQSSVDAFLSRYACPITTLVMEDPVSCQEGETTFTFERSAIEEWLASGNGTNPMTRRPLAKTDLVPNKTMLKEIRQIRGFFRTETQGRVMDRRLAAVRRAADIKVHEAERKLQQLRNKGQLAQDRALAQVQKLRNDRSRLQADLHMARKALHNVMANAGQVRVDAYIRVIMHQMP